MAVLVTRPDERGKALVDQLNQAGVVALHLPLLSIEAGAELAQLPTKLNQLKSGDYVFLVSKSAVDFEGEKRDRLFSNETVFPQRLPSTHLARLNEINLDIPPHLADAQLAKPLETSSEY